MFITCLRAMENLNGEQHIGFTYIMGFQVYSKNSALDTDQDLCYNGTRPRINNTETDLTNESPFDKARKQCSDFAWNLLSSIQVYRVNNVIDMKELDDKENARYELLLTNHCKHLSNEVEQ